MTFAVLAQSTATRERVSNDVCIPSSGCYTRHVQAGAHERACASKCIFAGPAAHACLAQFDAVSVHSASGAGLVDQLQVRQGESWTLFPQGPPLRKELVESVTMIPSQRGQPLWVGYRSSARYVGVCWQRVLQRLLSILVGFNFFPSPQIIDMMSVQLISLQTSRQQDPDLQTSSNQGR